MRLLCTLTIMGVLLLAMAGCDRAPSNLGPEYHTGKCVVCKRKTQVANRLMNPINGYAVEVCWREDCQRTFGANPNKFADKAQMPKPGEMPFNIPEEMKRQAPPSVPIAPR